MSIWQTALVERQSKTDPDIVLCRRKNLATGEREYWTKVRGVEVDKNTPWRRASDAIRSAQEQKPEIVGKQEAEKAAVLASKVGKGEADAKPDSAADPAGSNADFA